MLYLKKIGTDDIQKEYIFVRDMPEDENGFLNDWHGVSFETFRDKAVRNMLEWSRGENLPEGFVPETFYFLWDNDEIVGQFRLRHHLCDSLRSGAGHIGYYISPEHRGRGYATKGLRLLLEEAREIVPEDEIYLRVNRDNPASLNVMLKNGGCVHHQDENKYYVRIKNGD